jgi:hypothetical protein
LKNEECLKSKRWQSKSFPIALLQRTNMDEAMQDPEEDRAKYKGKKNKTKGGGGGGGGGGVVRDPIWGKKNIVKIFFIQYANNFPYWDHDIIPKY